MLDGTFSGGLELYPKHGVTALQVIHIFVTCGRMAASVLTPPFVSQSHDSKGVSCQGGSNPANMTRILSSFSNTNESHHEWESGGSRIHVAFAICGSFGIATSVYIVAIWLSSSRNGERRDAKPCVEKGKLEGDGDAESRVGKNSVEERVNHDIQEERKSSFAGQGALVETYKHTRFTKASTIFWSALMLGFETGLESTATAYMFNFLSYLGIENGAALNINSYFNITINVFRIAFIFINLKVPVRASLIFCVLLATGSMVGMIFAGQNETLVLIFCILLGVGLSSNYPSMYAFINDRVRMTPKAGGIILCAAGVVRAVDPVIISQFICQTPQVFLYTLLGNMAVVLISFTFLELSIFMYIKTGLMKARDLTETN